MIRPTSDFDEVLAGDEAFHKCNDYQELKSGKHDWLPIDMGAVKKYCTLLFRLKWFAKAIGDFDVSDQHSFDNLNRIHIMEMEEGLVTTKLKVS